MTNSFNLTQAAARARPAFAGLLLLTAGFLAPFASGATGAGRTGAPAAVVNGVPIPAAAVTALVDQGVRNGLQRSPQSMALARNDLIRRELLWQEARRLGFDKAPEVVAVAGAQGQKALPESTFQTLVVREYLKDYALKNPVTDAQLKAAYNSMLKPGKKMEYHAKDIVLRTREEALSALLKIKSGQTFEAVAAQSADAQTRSSGGDLGWGTAAKYPPAVTSVLGRLRKGEVARQPIELGSTFHVVKLEDSRPITPLPFDTMKPLLAQQLKDEQIAALVKRLYAKAKIQ